MTKGRNDDAQARDPSRRVDHGRRGAQRTHGGRGERRGDCSRPDQREPEHARDLPGGQPGRGHAGDDQLPECRRGHPWARHEPHRARPPPARRRPLRPGDPRHALRAHAGAAAGQFNATAVNVTPFVSPFFSSFLNDFGFGFNPVADAIRVVEEENLNFRFSPNNGNSLGLDGNLNPGDPRIVAADYTNSFDGATSTTLYDIDSGSDRLFTQGSVGGVPVSPNTGNLIDVGPLGVDTTDNAGLDIAQASGTAYASFEPAGSPGSSVLHRLNLSTGAATPVGTIAGGMPLESLSVVPASVLQFPSSATAVTKSSGQVQIPVTRTGPANRTATVAYSLSTGSGGMLTFAPGDYQENITVPTTGNVTITLSGESANAILGPQSSTSVVVVDDTAQTPQPSPGPGNDNTAPVLLAKAGALKRGVLRVRFSCNEACFVRASVRLGGKTVGTATDSIGRAGTGRLRIRLNGAGRTARRSKLTLRLTARDRAGNTRSLSLPLG